MIKYLYNEDTLRHQEQEPDGEAERILIGRFGLQVEDGRSEAPDPNAWTG